MDTTNNSSVQTVSNLKLQYKQARNGFIIFLIMAILLFPFPFIAVLALSDTGAAFPEGNLAYCIDNTLSDKDYIIKEAKIYGAYAEFYMTEDEVVSDENEKSSIEDFYVASVTDTEGESYFISLSFERESDFGKLLKGYDFDASTYTISGYFTAKRLTTYINDFTNESAQNYFDETFVEAGILNPNTHNWNFEYLFPETADYAEEKAETVWTLENIFMVLFFFIGEIVVCYIANNNRKKKNNLKKQIDALGA